MIRFLLRLLGFLILAAGFVALVIDGTKAIASGIWDFTKAGTTWTAFAPDSLARARELIGEAGAPVLNGALALPIAAVLAAIGILLMLIGRRRSRRVGVAP